jgi:hypothetical protein
MENKFYKLNESADWSDYTFVFPSVCIGNIGQLAIDLLISSTLTNSQKAGYLVTDLVQPIVGHNPFVQNSTDLSLNCERKRYCYSLIYPLFHAFFRKGYSWNVLYRGHFYRSLSLHR